MAYYKYKAELTQSNLDIFDALWEPGQSVTYKGIYKCIGCGREIAANEQFPPQNHHQHAVLQGKIRWKLTAWASPS